MSKINSCVLSTVAAWKARGEEGQGLAEYGLILALIAVVCIAALTGLGSGVKTKLGSVTAAL